MESSLPKFITKYFWGDNLSELSWEQHSQYISKTLLEKGNKKAISWLMKRVNKQKLFNQLTFLKLNPKSANFWRLYLS